MNPSFWRKIIYLSMMVVLLVPLYLLSNPETTATSQGPKNKGGMLARYRTEHGLSQSNLGEIDPTSETIKLATLGMRGIAANILWTQANHYHQIKDWDKMSAVLTQISRLQPNFISVWRYQAWNLSYNVSVEWDDYRQRYAYVIRGVNFLREGTQYNENEPLLPWDMGWTCGHKIGTADERKLYRVLFREDNDFNAGRPLERRDNWLVGKEFLQESLGIVDNRSVPAKGMGPALFYSGPAKWQINYAGALEIDGGLDGKAVFGDRARTAWEQANREWTEFANTRDLPTSAGLTIRLAELERYQQLRDEQVTKLDELAPGLRAKLSDDKKAALTESQRHLFDLSLTERTVEQQAEYLTLLREIAVSDAELVKALPADKRPQAQQLATAAARARSIVAGIDSARDTIQYDYWKTRCEGERLPSTIAARELMTKAGRAYLIDTDLETARTLYEQSFAEWRKSFDALPALLDDKTISSDLIGPDFLPGAIRNYLQVLKSLDEKFPEKFVLQDLLDRSDDKLPLSK